MSGQSQLELDLRIRTSEAPANLPLPNEIPLQVGLQLDKKDQGTSGHCRRLSHYALRLGRALQLSPRELHALRIGGVVHDIGKLAVPDLILRKPAPLNEQEWTIMRQHPIVGERMCSRIAGLRPALPIVRHHHERWDGSGYPDHLVGDGIPLIARIVQIVDVFDALTTARPYKPAWTTAQALITMQGEADRGWLDRRLFREFSRISR
jgi:putative two-component system response regulator